MIQQNEDRSQADKIDMIQHLGLNEDIFRQLSSGALNEYFRVTSDHSPGAGGTYLYHEAVRALRQLTRRFGYEKRDIGGICFTVNSDKKIAIAISSGDLDVGYDGGIPQFRYPKGPSSRQALQIVAGQADFFSHPTMVSVQDSLAEGPFKELAGYEIWWWIHFIDLAQNQMRCELSLPAEVSLNGVVKSWQSRIIFDSIPLDDEPSVEPDDPLGGDDVNVPVVSMKKRD